MRNLLIVLAGLLFAAPALAAECCEPDAECCEAGAACCEARREDGQTPA